MNSAPMRVLARRLAHPVAEDPVRGVAAVAALGAILGATIAWLVFGGLAADRRTWSPAGLGVALLAMVVLRYIPPVIEVRSLLTRLWDRQERALRECGLDARAVGRFQRDSLAAPVALAVGPVVAVALGVWWWREPGPSAWAAVAIVLLAGAGALWAVLPVTPRTARGPHATFTPAGDRGEPS